MYVSHLDLSWHWSWDHLLVLKGREQAEAKSMASDRQHSRQHPGETFGVCILCI